MSEALIAIDRPSQIPALGSALQAFAAQGAATRVVALDLELFEMLAPTGVPIEWIDQGVDSRLHDRADHEALELAHDWFRFESGSEESDLTAYGEISLGRLVAWEMTYFFAEALRCRRNVEMLLERTRPRAVLSLAEPAVGGTILLHPNENFHHDALRAACAERRIPFELRVCSQVSPPAPPAPSPVGVSGSPGARRRESGERGTVLSAGVQSVTPALVDELRARGFERLLVVGSAGELRDHPHVAETDVARFFSTDDTVQVAAEMRECRREHRDFVLRKLARQMPLLRGLDCVTRRLDFLFGERLAAAYGRYRAYRRLIEIEEVGAVLLHNDVTEDGRALALAASSVEVPSLVLLHGAVGHPIGCLPVAADRVGVYGPHFTRWFRERGVAPERLVEIGSPRFRAPDPDRSERLRGETRAELGLSVGDRFVVLALQHCNRATRFANVHWSREQWRRLVRAAIDAASRRPHVHLGVKIHPAAEDADSWRSWLAEQNPHARCSLIGSGLGAEALLAAADGLITGWSTLGLEGVVAGVPLLTANFSGRETPISYAELGLADHVSHPHDFEAAFDRLLSGPARVAPSALARVLVAQGDEAASRTADVVRGLADGCRRGVGQRAVART